MIDSFIIKNVYIVIEFDCLFKKWIFKFCQELRQNWYGKEIYSMMNSSFIKFISMLTKFDCIIQNKFK